MAFKKKTWVDRLSEFAGRRLLTRVSGNADGQMVVDVVRAEGNVSRAGDAFSAANMNDLEQRIADEFEEVNNDLSGVSFHPEQNGLYAEYMVGADAVRKKLGSASGSLTIGYSYNVRVDYSTTTGATNYNPYINTPITGTITIVLTDGVITEYKNSGGTGVSEHISTGKQWRGSTADFKITSVKWEEK